MTQMLKATRPTLTGTQKALELRSRSSKYCYYVDLASLYIMFPVKQIVGSQNVSANQKMKFFR